jgi:hypothetical protein
MSQSSEFTAITLCVASQRVFDVVIVAIYFVIDSVRKLLDTPSQGLGWIRLVQDRDQRRAVVNTVMNLRVP